MTSRSGSNKVLLVFSVADEQTRRTIENLAKYVHEGGPEVERWAMQKNRNNPAFWCVSVDLRNPCEINML